MSGPVGLLYKAQCHKFQINTGMPQPDRHSNRMLLRDSAGKADPIRRHDVHKKAQGHEGYAVEEVKDFL